MRKIIVAVVAAVALGLGLVAVPAGASTTATSSTTLHYSSHWAGYAALAKSGSTVKSFTAASAVFTVPSLNCQATPNATVMQLAALGVSGQPTDGVGVIESCHN